MLNHRAVDRSAINAAADALSPYVRETPVIAVQFSDFGLDHDRPLVLKLELLQHSGSFKVRGAFTNLLTRPIPPSGIVAASGGNHGAAVAFAANRLEIPARIFVPAISSPTKIQQIRDYGAELEIVGQSYADALAASEVYQDRTRALAIHAFDQAETLIGQGTLGRELDQQSDGLDTVMIAVGGGGLIGGVASWFHPATRIVAVEPEASPTLSRALEAGRPVDADVGGIAADSLAPRRIGELVFPIVSRRVQQVILVSDEEIKAAQRALWKVLRVVAEPGGAAAFAALLAGRYTPSRDERIAVVLCGGNTTAVDFDR